jgi:integral membrane protein (TIGR01906 family)
MSQTFRRVLSILTTVMVPFVLLMLSIRILFTPLFMQLEYRMPGFPADTYGFTLDDRLHWSRVSLEYLLNDAGIEYLADQRLPDGTPLYNERELSHMLDVKILVQQMIKVLWMLVGLLLVFGAWAWSGGWWRDFLRGLANGGRLTIGLIALILAAVAISFRELFTAFHRIFFVGDTWLFYFSDSLIRLFPMRFWQDGFILMGLVTIGGAALLIWAERRWASRA